jgi:hypothetical protein
MNEIRLGAWREIKRPFQNGATMLLCRAWFMNLLYPLMSHHWSGFNWVRVMTALMTVTLRRAYHLFGTGSERPGK